jgi:hypothetical protein
MESGSLCGLLAPPEFASRRAKSFVLHPRSVRLLADAIEMRLAPDEKGLGGHRGAAKKMLEFCGCIPL